MAYSDDEDDDDGLLITLIKPITHGSLEVTAGSKISGNKRSRRMRVGDSFTQQQVDDRAVR